jgi:hypothetical protein
MSAADPVEIVARAAAQLEPGEAWPTNAALGGSPTGTRDDEYYDALHEEAREIVAALRAEGFAL